MAFGLPPGIQGLLHQVRSLSEKEYQDFMCQAFDSSRSPSTQRSIVKFYTKKGSRNAKNLPPSESGVDIEGKHMSCPSRTVSKSAWKSPFIFNSDLLPENGTLYFDVEKLSLIKLNEKTHKTVAATIAVVNELRDLVMWAFIYWDPKSVCQFFPQMTGLDQTKIMDGITLTEVQKFFGMCCAGNKVVGLDVKGDFESLGIKAPDTYEDLHDYFFEMKPHANNPNSFQKCGYSLKDLSKHFFGESEFQCGQHSAIADARMTQKLHKKKEELIQLFPSFQDYPGVIERSKSSKYVFDPSDVCRCKRK